MSTDETDQLERLYPALAPVIHRRALALLGDEDEALDATQDVFLKLQRKLATFRGRAALLTWVYRVTTNHCLNQIRARKTRGEALRRLNREQTMYSPAEGVSPAKHAERRDLLRHLLARFDQRKVQILVHLHYDGMTQAEIAAVLGISERAVRKAIKNVKDRVEPKAIDALKEEL